VTVLLFACQLSFSAHATESKKAPWPTEQWVTATPESQGLDQKRLSELVDLIREGREFPRLHSLLIARNGYLVVEEYFSSYGSDDLHTLQSVSKSYTSALMGIAIEQGKIKNVDEKVLDFFPHYTDLKNVDERKRAMTLEHLLTMQSGTDYHESPYRGSPHEELNNLATGWDRFVLNRKMIRPPGTAFQYDSGGVILMSSLLKARTGSHADEFAERYLFEPLGVRRSRWFRNQEGHPHTGGGLDLLPRDMAKFGLLYLRHGRWKDRQIVPEDWVIESTRQRVSLTGRGRVVGYGYLWWILAPDPDGLGKESIYAAMGFRAQYIFVIPEHDMVVVVTGGTTSGVDQRKPIEFLYSHILPSVAARAND
jgi:CubicO group peptidase (beta-lactamase class C family)